MWPESVQCMGPEWFNFGGSSKFGRPNSPWFGDVHRLSPRLQGGPTAPGSTVVGRTDAATSGKSGVPVAYIGDAVPAKLAANIHRWEYVLLPEFWVGPRDPEGEAERARCRQGRKVTEIFTWV